LKSPSEKEQPSHQFIIARSPKSTQILDRKPELQLMFFNFETIAVPDQVEPYVIVLQTHLQYFLNRDIILDTVEENFLSSTKGRFRNL
jgi:hypothetical protein